MKKIYLVYILCGFFSFLKSQAIDYNVTGTITCSGVGVAGVLVSDGELWTETDEKGTYYLNSSKKSGHVFYIIPEGYMPYFAPTAVQTEKIFGGFWRVFNYPTNLTKKETINFKLRTENNDNHIMIFQADPQIGNRSDVTDLALYKQMYFPAMKREYDQVGATPAYTTVLGDLSWDAYWYDKKYALPNYKSTIAENAASFKFKHFSVMGNHDNDGATPCDANTDYLAATAYRTNMGPNYYSFNMGKIHYIVFDDIVYINSGEPDAGGCVGSRNYSTYITDQQLDWIEKDLSYVSKDKTIFLCTHCPLWGLDAAFNPYVNLSQNSTQKLCNLVKDYKAVHILTGHRHNTYNMEPTNYGYDNIYEHNIGAVGGNLWWAGYYGGHPNCNDGTPGGWQVFYINGDDVSWQFHTMENNGNAQFRVIDGNTLKNFYKTNTTIPLIRAKYSRQDYSTIADNAIIVNVFNYDPKWKVEIFEGSTSLKVERWRCEDVYHTLTYDIPRFEYYLKKEGAGRYTTDNSTGYNTHSHYAIASSPTSTITVKVTDRFGNVYQKTVTRPIPCTVEALTPGNEEMILTGTQKTIAESNLAKVCVNGNIICIDTPCDDEAQITSIDGTSQIVKLSEGHNEIPVTQKNIYIITVNGKSTKVLVK